MGQLLKRDRLWYLTGMALQDVCCTKTLSASGISWGCGLQFVASLSRDIEIQCSSFEDAPKRVQHQMESALRQIQPFAIWVCTGPRPQMSTQIGSTPTSTCENACKVVRKQRTFPTPKFWNHELCCEWHHVSFLSLSVYKLLTLCVSGLNRWNSWWNSVLSFVWLRNPLAFEDGLDVKVLRPEVLVQDSESWRYLNECTWGSFRFL